MKSKNKNKNENNKDEIELLYFNKNENKTLNKNKIIGLSIIISIFLILLIIYILYANCENIRMYVDKNIFNKQINENELMSIPIKDYEKSNIFTYSKYIAILNNNKLLIYNSVGNKERENNIIITEPIINSNDSYAIIAEKNGSKMYLLKDDEIKWEKNLEGNITRITVNSNGYTAAILSGTAYKSVIIIFDNEGKEIFKTYVSRTIAVDICISEDNKYLSIAEIDTTGALVQSNIKIVSIDKAKNNPEECIEYIYREPSNSLILDINYQNKNKLICQYDNSVHLIKDNQDTKILELDTKKEKVSFLSINLKNDILKVIEENKINAKSIVKLINSTNKKEAQYKFDGVIKELYCKGNKIALNLGTEVHFIDSKGWLIKKYTSKKAIRRILLDDKIAGIVYRDKIEIVKF